ncbi:MAG: elongation factor P lysine(34) lysyltransferase [Idiomarina sp.]|uniref:EF-P lysine aminoacylase EpmA n=1 Tax=Idiomarina sp. TaxID=1874361 RepID=UPI000C545BC5|nr:EF-P lysine aminoacylase EpmA [Idiomarina sp.]MBT42887.1 elongation factor P lysine(34) lysyltransferase [Idiomarina sp.]
MDWRSEASLQTLQQRAELMRQIRQFFYQRNVLEVDTPLLARHGVTDPHLENLTTTLSAGPDGQPLKLSLQTSPEYAMKRLLAQYRTSIFQLSHVFRDDEIGRHHNPEFSLVEWYRVGFNLVDLIAEVSELIQYVTDAPPVITYTYQEIFVQCTGWDPLQSEGISAIHRHLKTRSDTRDWMEKETDPDTILQLAFNVLIEPQLPSQTPVAITHFPRSQAALARVCPEDERVSLRFEIYYQGIELANGYDELTDTDEQNRRFVEDNAKRRQLQRAERTADEYLLAALRHGMPPCSGVALGFDRLLMIALNKDQISSVVPFSIANC